MRRIVMLLAVVALMVALAAGPVLAGGGARNCNVTPQGEQCQGGSGFGERPAYPGYVLGGGAGFHERAGDEVFVSSGGFGIGGSVGPGGGGQGYYCTYDYIETLTCVGGGGQGGTGEF